MYNHNAFWLGRRGYKSDLNKGLAIFGPFATVRIHTIGLTSVAYAELYVNKIDFRGLESVKRLERSSLSLISDHSEFVKVDGDTPVTITGCPLGLIHIIPLGIKVRYQHMRAPDNLDVILLTKKIIERDG